MTGEDERKNGGERLELSRQDKTRRSKLSVIVPVYEERRELESFMNWWESLPGNGDIELVMCLAKSDEHDESVKVIRGRAQTLKNLAPSRASQMNQGAKAAKGEHMLFIHIDSRPPVDFREVIAKILSRPGNVAGVFSHSFRESGEFLSLELISCVNRLRYWLTGAYYGDQGLFLRAEDFRKIGGFDNFPLMEDVAMVRKLKSLGRVVCSKKVMKTSGRRFLKNGPWKTFFWIWYLRCRDIMGLGLKGQAEAYRQTK